MAETEFYYKRIEAAISDLKSITASLRQLVEGTGFEGVFSELFNDAKDTDNQFESVWIDYLDIYKSRHKLQSLDDNQKEEVALNHKDIFDNLLKAVQDYSAGMSHLLPSLKALKGIINANLKIWSEYDKFMTQYVDVSWDSEDETHTQLVLTPLELFYAITFLNEPTVRAIFAHVGPGVLEEVLKAYHAKDKNAFCHIVKAKEVRPSDKLLDYLIAEKRELSLSGIMSLLPSEPSERIKLLDALNNNPVEDIFLEEWFDDASTHGEDLSIQDVINLFGESVVRSVGECCVNSKIPLKFRKKFMTLYNQARTTFTEIPNLSELTPCESENEIGLKIIDKLRISYIMKKIREAMEADSGNCITDIEMSNIVPSDIRKFNFPTRLAACVSPNLYANEKIAVLTEIYQVFGGSFENMTCDDFVYLFGASNKVPSTYNLPYYWCGDESTLKAILRILYIRQPRLLRTLILHVSDKKNGATGHDWGRNKDRVAYVDIEGAIANIVLRVTGKTLKKI